MFKNDLYKLAVLAGALVSHEGFCSQKLNAKLMFCVDKNNTSWSQNMMEISQPGIVFVVPTGKTLGRTQISTSTIDRAKQECISKFGKKNAKLYTGKKGLIWNDKRGYHFQDLVNDRKLGHGRSFYDLLMSTIKNSGTVGEKNFMADESNYLFNEIKDLRTLETQKQKLKCPNKPGDIRAFRRILKALDKITFNNKKNNDEKAVEIYKTLIEDRQCKPNAKPNNPLVTW